jgi:hypothetical protein
VISQSQARPPRPWPAAALVAVYWLAWAIVNTFLACYDIAGPSEKSLAAF